jgi:hypothetical protein
MTIIAHNPQREAGDNPVDAVDYRTPSYGTKSVKADRCAGFHGRNLRAETGAKIEDRRSRARREPQRGKRVSC